MGFGESVLIPYKSKLVHQERFNPIVATEYLSALPGRPEDLKLRMPCFDRPQVSLCGRFP